MPWPWKVYADGSGLGPKVKEARRCGWAMVALRPGGLPLRAQHGALPGACQTVGRAERYACLNPLRQAGDIASDLQSLVKEGNEWSGRDASAEPAGSTERDEQET